MRNVRSGWTIARNIDGTPGSGLVATSDRFNVAGSATGVAPRSKITLPVTVRPGTRRSVRLLRSVPSTTRSITLQSVGVAASVATAPRWPEPVRATSVYCPGATPVNVNPDADTIARGSASAPDATSASTGDGWSPRFG